MSKTITINKENFKVDENDFNTIPHLEFNNLNILVFIVKFAVPGFNRFKRITQHVIYININ